MVLLVRRDDAAPAAAADDEPFGDQGGQGLPDDGPGDTEALCNAASEGRREPGGSRWSLIWDLSANETCTWSGSLPRCGLVTVTD